MEKLNLSDRSVNVGDLERNQSLISGTLFVIAGMTSIRRKPVSSLLKSLIGGYLIYRSISGHCHINQMLERDTRE
ncbi:MAG: DUF2892 domain-containing protein [Bacteroidota bacterium]|nr:DUF2892 domain-containing protein [Bacteroidota bacterium]